MKRCLTKYSHCLKAQQNFKTNIRHICLKQTKCNISYTSNFHGLNKGATSSFCVNLSRNLSSSKMEVYVTDKAYINGKLKSAKSTFPVYNPYTCKLLGNAANCDREDALEAVKAAKQAFKTWKSTTAKERSEILKKFFHLMTENKNALAQLLTSENGKPINESLGEIGYAAGFTEWLAEEARRSYGITIPAPHPNKKMMSIKQPIGVSGMVTPWNFPCAMITRKACAAIAAGCTVVLKPSEDTPYSAVALAMLAEKAGLPPGVLNILPCSRENVQQVGEVISTHPDVAALSFTGSTATGKLLLKQAADTVKKVSLELGGLAPFIVFDSADVDKATTGAMGCKFRFMGQTCVCANVLYVQEGIHDQFVESLIKKMREQLKSGDTMNPGNTFGPLINQKAYDKVKDQVEDAVRLGGKIITGGVQGSNGGTFFEPTLITDISTNMKCFSNETFGPIAPIYKFKTEEEVLGLANDCRVGLAGYFYSSDISQCWRVAENLEVGMVGINESLISCCEAPFGGVKESGLGREGSADGLEEYMETKYLCFGV